MRTRWKLTTAAGTVVHLPACSIVVHVNSGGNLTIGGVDGVDPLILACPANATPILFALPVGEGSYRITGADSRWECPPGADGGGDRPTEHVP